MPEEEFIINVFCLIDDLFNKLFPRPLRTRGYEPKLSDSEVLTIEIVGEWLGHHKDKDIWKYFRRHWLHFFSRHSRQNQAGLTGGEPLGCEAKNHRASGADIGR